TGGTLGTVGTTRTGGTARTGGTLGTTRATRARESTGAALAVALGSERRCDVDRDHSGRRHDARGQKQNK
ncbi:MAG TPA: hypothetical protein VGF70_03765, partial [Solirubrobacteraceae bacterium]